MKKKNIFKAAAVLIACMFLAAPAAAEDTEYCTSSLTGRQVPVSIGRKRPIAVMFNNIYDALPMYGIGSAEVCIEAEVEGLITRVMGILEDYKDCGRIGSVRSARNYYYYFAREYQAIYCHYGEAAYALPLIRLDSTVELSGLTDYGDTVYYRSDDRVSPHNVFLNYDRVQNGIDIVGFDPNLPEDYDRSDWFAKDGEEVYLENGTDANVVLPGYVYNHARFVYSIEDGLYYRYQFGEPHIDGNDGTQVACKNIILQYCHSVPFDENGYLWTDVVNGGTGKYITNGKAIDITWRKRVSQQDSTYIVDINTPNVTVPLYTGDFSETLYFDMDGNPIKLNQGKTWICLVRDGAAGNVVVTDDYSVPSDIYG